MKDPFKPENHNPPPKPLTEWIRKNCVDGDILIVSRSEDELRIKNGRTGLPYQVWKKLQPGSKPETLS